MNKHLPLFLVILFITCVSAHAQVINPCAPIGSDLCIDAPLINSCQLNGWRSTTNPPDENYQWNGDVPRVEWCNGGFSIENNQWLKFVAEEDHMYLDVDVSECANGNGIQMACYKPLEVQSNVPGECVGEQIACFGAQSGQNISTVFRMEPLIVGETYLIMIDGWAGDGCPFTLWIESGVEIPLNVVATTYPLCPGYPSLGVLSALGSDIGPDFIYGWDTQDGNIVSGHYTLTPVIDEPGEYTFTAYDLETCCWASTSVVVEEATLDDYPTAIASADRLLGCGENTVTLSAEGSSFDDVNNNPDFLYGWLDENGEQVHTGFEFPGIAEPGTYTLVVFNWRTGCSSETTVEVVVDTVPPAMDPLALGILDCNNSEIFISANPDTSNYTFAWEGPNGFTSADSTFAASETGNYTVTVTGANGCTNVYDLSVDSDFEEPPLTADGGTLNCNDMQIALSASSDVEIVSYSWQGPNGYTSSDQNPMVDVPGMYTVSAIGLNGCLSTFEIEVGEDFEEPNIQAEVEGELNCNVAEVLLSGISDDDIVSYSWQGPNGFISTESNPTATTVGEYTLTVTAPNGCQSDVMINVTDDFEEPDLIFAEPEILTCDVLEVLISGSSSDSDVSFEWFNSGLSLGDVNEIEVTEPGEYTLLVTGANGCTHEENLSVSQNIVPPLADAGPDGLITCQETEASLSGIASETGTDIVYTWFGAGGNEIGDNVNINVNNPGLYTLVVTNLSNGCSSADEVEIMADESLPIADAGPELFITCDNATVTLDGSNSSTGASISYEWIDENGVSIGSSLNQNIQEEGVYTLIVSDSSNGCETEAQVQVTQDTEDPIVDLLPGTELNCNNLNAILDASGSTGSDDLQFSWIGPNGSSISSDAVTEITQAGTYIITIINPNNGCTASDELTITENFMDPIADPGSPFTITCTESFGTLNGGNSSGTDLTYQWLDANGNEVSTEVSFETENSGDYTLIVTDQNNGCTNAAQINIEEDTDFPLIETLVDGILSCENQSVVLDGSASSVGSNFTYQWLDANGQVISNELLANTESPGFYTLIVFNTENSCESEMEIEVEQNINPPNVDPGNDLTITCDVNEVMLDGSASSAGANIVYEWQNANGVVLGDQSQLTVSNPDTYILIVTDLENGCSEQASVEVVPDENIPVSNVAVDDILDCNITSVNLNSLGSSTGGSITQQWIGPNGNSLGQDEMLEVSDPGVYTLQLIDENNGCSSEASIVVEQDVLDPELDIVDPEILDCANNSVEIQSNAVGTGINFNGMLNYSWFDVDGNMISSDENITTAEAGLYTLIVTDPSNGCSVSQDVTVLEDIELPIADAGLPATLTCETNVIMIGGSTTSSGDDYIYVWQDGNGAMLGETPSLEVNAAGTYTLVVTNTRNSCQVESEVIIDEDADFPNVDAGPMVTLTCEFTELSIGSLNSDQGPDIRYEWYDENANLVGDALEINIDAPGLYELHVLNDENGCSAISTVEVEQDVLAPAIITNSPDILTCTEPTVALSAFGSSSGPNITYEWLDEGGSNIGAEEIITVSDPGLYTLLVYDLNNGCSSELEVEVQVDENTPVSDAGPDQILNCSINNVVLDGSASIGNDGVVFEWRDENGQVLTSDLNYEVGEPGVYTLYVFDPANGCEDESQVIISEDILPPLAAANEVDDLTCIEPIQTVSAQGSSEGDIFSYEWLDVNGLVVSNEFSFETETAGTYFLTVYNTENGCNSSTEIVVEENQLDPTALADILGPQTINCETSSILLDGSASSPFPNLEFTWFDANGNIIDSENQTEVNEPGLYTLLVTDLVNGCMHQTDINIVQDVDDPTVVISPPDIINCYNPLIQLDALSSSDGPEFEYIWSSPSGGQLSDISILNPEITEGGVYTLTILNLENGCEASESVEVLIDQEAPEVATAVLDELDCVTPLVDLDGDGSSTGSKFTYLWTGENEVINATSLNPSVSEAGTYELLVTNTENGCTSLKPIQVFRNEQEPTDAIIDLKDITCYGFDDGRIEIEGVVGGTEPYLYSFQGSEFNSEILFDNLGPGTYPLQLIDALGCEWETILTVVEPEQVFVDLGPDMEIELGDVVDLSANSNGTYIEWMSEDSLDCQDNCFVQQVSPFVTTSYFVEVTDENGCPEVDEILLKVDRTRAVYIPNAFSPNGDGINDFFTVYKNKTVKQVKKMLIADRWGEIVFVAENFEPEDPAHGWTGVLRDESFNTGVFVYYAEVEFVDGFIGKYKGDVTIMR